MQIALPRPRIMCIIKLCHSLYFIQSHVLITNDLVTNNVLKFFFARRMVGTLAFFF
jgi:hypothetical protein